MKLLNILFILLFLVSAALQYNDPDPYVWMPIYLYGAYLCLQAVRGRFSAPLYILGFVVYSAYAVYLLFDKTGVLNWAGPHGAESIVQKMEDSKPWIEETREFFGLVILIVVLLANWIWLRRKRLQPARP